MFDIKKLNEKYNFNEIYIAFNMSFYDYKLSISTYSYTFYIDVYDDIIVKINLYFGKKYNSKVENGDIFFSKRFQYEPFIYADNSDLYDFIIKIVNGEFKIDGGLYGNFKGDNAKIITSKLLSKRREVLISNLNI